MPNYCFNELVISSKNKSDLLEMMKNIKGNKRKLDFVKIIPPPDMRMIETDEGFNGNIQGLPSGYEWCIENWGTKWNACDITRELIQCKNKWMVIYEFYTAWSPPIPIIKKLSKKYPNLSVSLHYEERGMGYTGDLKCKNGKVILDCFRRPTDAYELFNLRGG